VTTAVPSGSSVICSHGYLRTPQGFESSNNHEATISKN
jgi:hypothetical protein